MRVEIIWSDSGLFYENGWESIDDIKSKCTGIARVSTVGHFLFEDDEAYYVALSADEAHGHYFGVQAIKKTNVESYKYV